MDNFYEFIEKFFVPAILPIIIIFITHYLQNRKVDTVKKDVDSIQDWINEIKELFKITEKSGEIYDFLENKKSEIENFWFKIVWNRKVENYKSLVENNDFTIWIDKYWLLYINTKWKSIEKDPKIKKILDIAWFKKLDEKDNYNIYNEKYEDISNKSAEKIYEWIKLYMEEINNLK